MKVMVRGLDFSRRTMAALFLRLPNVTRRQTEGRMATTGLLGSTDEEGSMGNQAALVMMKRVWP